MSPRPPGFVGRYIVVADEDKVVVCDLVISNTRVGGVAGIDLIHELREHLPSLAILYLANTGRSTPEVEARLPHNIPILREPFSPGQLRAAVRYLLA